MAPHAHLGSIGEILEVGFCQTVLVVQELTSRYVKQFVNFQSDTALAYHCVWEPNYRAGITDV